MRALRAAVAEVEKVRARYETDTGRLRRELREERLRNRHQTGQIEALRVLLGQSREENPCLKREVRRLQRASVVTVALPGLLL